MPLAAGAADVCEPASSIVVTKHVGMHPGQPHVRGGGEPANLQDAVAVFLTEVGDVGPASFEDP
jgi:hypothetical protein